MKLRISFFAGCLFLLFFFASGAVWGQNGAMEGEVIRNEQGGEAIAGAMVRADGANTTRSKSFGEFELNFVDRKAGEETKIRVRKEGLVVVNHLDLKAVIPAPGSDPFTIIMCNSGERDLYATKYYQISVERLIEKNYKSKVDEISTKIANKTAEAVDYQALATYSNERNQAMKKAEDVGKRLASIDPDSITADYEQVINNFRKGNFNKVLELLPDEKLEDDFRKAEELEKKGRDAKLRVIEMFQLKANTLLFSFQFEEACLYFEKAIEKDTSIYKNQLEYARMLLNYGKYAKADKYFQKALKLAANENQQAEVYALLGQNYSQLQDEEAALSACQEALNSFEKLPDSDWKKIQTLNTIGIIHQRTGQLEEAAKTYLKASSLAKVQEDIGEAPRQLELSRIYTNQGNLYLRQQKFSEALTPLEKAEQIKRELTLQDSAKYIADLGISLNNLGRAYDLSGKDYKALLAYEEAIGIYQSLLKQNPIVYRERLISLYVNKGLIFMNSDHQDGALEDFLTAQNYANWLMKKQPKALVIYMKGIISQNLGTSYCFAQDFEEALDNFHQSMNMRKKLAKANPKRFQRDVAKTQLDISKLYYLQLESEPGEAIKAKLISSLDSTGKALQTCPDNPDVQSIREDYESLVAFAQQIELKTIEQLLEAEQAIYQETDEKKMLKAYSKWIKNWENYRAKFPTVSVIAKALGKRYDQAAEWHLAHGFYEEATSYAQLATEADSENQSAWLSLCLGYMYTGSLTKAQVLIQKWSKEPFQNRTWKEVLSNRIQTLEEQGHISSLATQIESLLKQ